MHLLGFKNICMDYVYMFSMLIGLFECLEDAVYLPIYTLLHINTLPYEESCPWFCVAKLNLNHITKVDQAF